MIKKDRMVPSTPKHDDVTMLFAVKDSYRRHPYCNYTRLLCNTLSHLSPTSARSSSVFDYRLPSAVLSPPPIQERKSRRVFSRTFKTEWTPCYGSSDFYRKPLDIRDPWVCYADANRTVLLWNDIPDQERTLSRVYSADHHITSLSLSQDIDMAVGEYGDVKIHRVCPNKTVRTIKTGGFYSVCVSRWDGPVLTAGIKSGCLQAHDVRAKDSLIRSITAHDCQTTSMDRDSSGKLLATGGGDNVARVWDDRNGWSAPVVEIDRHVACVNLCWHPTQPHRLLTAGGSNDRTVKYWDVSRVSPVLISEAYTGLQVSSVSFLSKTPEAIVVTHGVFSDRMGIWNLEPLSLDQEIDDKSVMHSKAFPCQDRFVSMSGGKNEASSLWEIVKNVPKRSDEPLFECGTIR